MPDKQTYYLAEEVGYKLLTRQFMLASAESCTGGWLGQAITAVPGSSHWYERGFITYSNAAKMEMLGVASATLEKYGAVSEAVVKEMALGALLHSHAHMTVAISGVAGPDGGSAEKPVGIVCFAWAIKNHGPVCETTLFQGDRYAIRRQSVQYALQKIIGLLERDLA